LARRVEPRREGEDDMAGLPAATTTEAGSARLVVN
jgi:hypothetical protein